MPDPGMLVLTAKRGGEQEWYCVNQQIKGVNLVETHVVFRKTDVGCYADAAFGHVHVRRRLAGLVSGLGIDKGLIVDSLYGDMPDDAWDEYEALAILQQHTDAGLLWSFHDGNLLLWEWEDAQ